jgi:hypothetical protein
MNEMVSKDDKTSAQVSFGTNDRMKSFKRAYQAKTDRDFNFDQLVNLLLDFYFEHSGDKE